MDSVWIDLPPRTTPLVLPLPEAGAPGGLVTFEDTVSWRDVVVGLSLSPFDPAIVGLKYAIP
jgi:hypothetical protein